MGSNSSHHLQQPGDKLKKAIQEFSELLENDKDRDRNKLIQKIIAQFDMSPKEADFFTRQCRDNE